MPPVLHERRVTPTNISRAMPHALEYLVKDAILMCDKGAAPGVFSPTMNTNMKIGGALVSNEFDKTPIVNIPCFGACSVTGSPCAPAPVAWTDTYMVKVKGGETLLFQSTLPCAVGGKIESVTSGQVPLGPGGMDALMEEFGEQEEEEEGGWGWWDTAELIPVVGNVIGMVREARKGNWGMFALNAAFLVVDVVTFGAGAAVTTPLKGGVKAGVKVMAKTAAKATTKAGAKQLAKGAAKGFAKAAAKQVDDIAKASMKVCVFACFPAGTKVATADGPRNIEDIKPGDRVWSYDEETEENILKPVIDPYTKTVDATVTVRLADERIVTTAEHPFFTRKGYREAARLEPGDELMTREGHWHAVQGIDFAYEPTIVYNFEVEGLHNYFVGEWEWLVHNAPRCVTAAGKKLVGSADEAVQAARIRGRQISQDTYDLLRKKTPSKKIRNMVNKGKKAPYPDPVLPGLRVTGRLQADHIVSMDKITSMDGFGKLTRPQQLEVLNNPKNYTGLSEAANKSKGAKTFEQWTEHKKTGTKVAADFRDKMIKVEQQLEGVLQQQIDNFLKPPPGL